MNSPVVLITGAGSGLGRALAQTYAAEGARVVCADLALARAQETVALLAGQDRGHWAIAVDVADRAAMAAFVQTVYAREPAIDVLINNAGVATAGSVFESSFEDWDWVLSINLMGVVYGCKLIGERMLAAGRGHIINIASFAALGGAPRIASYSVAKAGVYALSEGMRADLHGTPVKVSVVCPAFFPTNLMHSARSNDSRLIKTAQRFMDVSGDTAESVAAHIFREAKRGTFLILPTRSEPGRWRIKRFAPNLYFKLMMKAIGSKMKGNKP